MENLEIFSYINDKPIYIDYVFLDFDNTPMIFACKDKKNNYYLGICCSMADEFRFLLTNISKIELIEIITKKYDLHNYFLSKGYVYQVFIDMNLKIETKKIEISTLNKMLIPGRNVYIKYTDGVKKYLQEI